MGPYVVVFSDTTFDTKCMLFFHIPTNSMTPTGFSTIQFPPYLPRIRVRSHELRGSSHVTALTSNQLQMGYLGNPLFWLANCKVASPHGLPSGLLIF